MRRKEERQDHDGKIMTDGNGFNRRGWNEGRINREIREIREKWTGKAKSWRQNDEDAIDESWVGCGDGGTEIRMKRGSAL